MWKNYSRKRKKLKNRKKNSIQSLRAVFLVSHKVEKPIKTALFVLKEDDEMNNDNKLMIKAALLRKESEYHYGEVPSKL